MTQTVPVLSIIFMGVSALVGFAIPIVLLVFFRKRKGADFLPFFVGCAVMIVFVLILESVVHRVILASPAGSIIRGNVWLYGLYGGLMAGLFEETGKFTAFRTVLKSTQGNDANALMYGAGHGGFEAAVFLGMPMINNIIVSVMINGGKMELPAGVTGGDAAEQIRATVQALAATPSYQFLIGGGERIFAVTLQIALSVLVWFAAGKKGRIYLYPAAVVIHAAVDAAAAILSGLGTNMLLIELVICVLALATALLARRIWRQEAAEGSGSPDEAAVRIKTI